MNSPIVEVQDYGLTVSNFFFFVNMENLPNLLYSLAVDGNARKEKGSRKEKKKKKGDQEMAMKQRKGGGTCNPKFQQKTMQRKGHSSGNEMQRRTRAEPSKQPSLSMWIQRYHTYHVAVRTIRLKGKKTQRGKSLSPLMCHFLPGG